MREKVVTKVVKKWKVLKKKQKKVTHTCIDERKKASQINTPSHMAEHD
jgi:hypothetical protein